MALLEQTIRLVVAVGETQKKKRNKTMLGRYYNGIRKNVCIWTGVLASEIRGRFWLRTNIEFQVGRQHPGF